MRIELQHSFFSPILSGQERRIHVLCDELLSRGFQVSICTPHDGVDKITPYEEKGLRLFLHPPFFSRKPKSLLDPILYVRRLQDFLRRRQDSNVPDLVLAFHYAYVAASKRAWPDVPVAFLPGATIRDWHSWLNGHRSLAARAILTLKRPAASYMEKEAVRSADQIFIESALLGDKFLHRYPKIKTKIRLWPTPVDTFRFTSSQSRREAIREKLGVDQATKIILAVGRLNWNKNFSTLIHAAAMLRRNDWLLLIVGQGSEEERLLGLVKARRLGDRVRFVNACSEMQCIYAGADIFAHPALFEPYGNVVLEAMASGLPCIVSPAANVGISRDLTDGTNALFADPQDRQDWANKIAHLLDDAELSANLGKEARKFCEDRPGWPSLTSRLLQECGLTPQMPSSVTVIIPTKNRPGDLELTLETVFQQSVLPGQLIIVDQSESDETQDGVMKQYADAPSLVHEKVQLSCIRDATIPSLTVARNRAIEMARGDIWLFLDDDVCLEPAFLEEVLAVYQRYPEVSGVSGIISNYQPPSPTYQLWVAVFARGPFHDERQSIYWVADRLRNREPIAVRKLGGGLMSFRAQAVSGCRFDENLQGVSDGEDVDFCTRLGPDATLVIAPRARLVHKASPVGRSQVHWLRRFAQSSHYLYHRNWKSGLGNRLRFAWLNFGMGLVATIGTVRRASLAPWRALLEGAEEGCKVASARVSPQPKFALSSGERSSLK